MVQNSPERAPSVAAVPAATMTAEQLREAGERLFGDRWQQEMAYRFRVDISTVRRWLRKDDVPGSVQAAIECWQRCREMHRLQAERKGRE